MTFPRWTIAGLGLLSALTAVLFVLAPVKHDSTTYSWPSGAAPRDTVLPLFPYEPARMDVKFGCADVEALGESGTLLSTTMADPLDLEQPSPPGLTVTVTNEGVAATVGAHTFVSPNPTGKPVSAGGHCTWTVRSDPDGTSMLLDGVQVGYTPERPAVNGFYTDLRGSTGLHATVVPDTRYETAPSILKIVLGVLTVAGLVSMLVLLGRREAPRVRQVRFLPQRWWRPRGPDIAVAATLLVWTVIGAPTVDDGYIISMLKEAGQTGFVGNYFRWFNAPESPFSWFYELYRPLAEISGSAWWMRLPSLLLGLVLWLLIDRLLLRRLAKGPGGLARWTAAAVFGVWYVQFGIGLRPEPWVMLGSLIVFVLVERALATRALTPLAVAVVAAGATVAVTPTGVVALAPFVAALPGVVRLIRQHWPVSLPVLLASGAGVLLLMFFDQSLPAVLHSTEVRTAIGPNFGVLDEPMRYKDVFGPMEGGLNRRMPLLLVWLSMAVLAVLLPARRTPGLAAAPTRRLLVVGALFFPALALTPTKYTHHFGALGAVATVLAAAMVHTLVRGALRRNWERSLVLAVTTVAVAVAVAAPLRWWFLAGLGVPWAKAAPGVRNIDLADMVLVGGLILAALVLLPRGGRRLLPSPAAVLALAAVGTVVVEVATMAYAIVPRWQTYTMGRANLASISGSSCGVEDWLDVEPNVRAGLLPRAPASPPPELRGFAVNAGFPGDVAPTAPYGSDAAPVWGSGGATGSVTTGWYSLPEGAGSPDVPPLVVPVGGTGAVRATVQFAGADGVVHREARLDLDRDGEWRDARLEPAGATRVRVVAVDQRDGDGWIAVGAPRLPKVVSLVDYIPPSERVAVDWIDAFFLPCREPASLAAGMTEPVRYRFASGPGIRKLASMSFVPDAGGPYAPLLQVARQTPVPTYLRGDKLSEPISVFRFDYPVPALRVRTAPS